mmetsp:Transcript_12885/g.19025  ORF Transcript_12885/g.19025 Transcript_12885/m.19025 type:complete len:457 (-) Transcript_12885:516-1886(-)
MTEVHHITSDGKDKGVVYSEMQGRENSDGSLVDRAILDLLYPKDCAYSSETGGKMKNLRVLTNDQVMRYHKENYTPDNVMFVLTGNVEEGKFLSALDKVELSVKQKSGGDGGIVPKVQGGRPWIHHVIPDMDLNAVGVMPPPPTSSSMEIEKDEKKEKPLEIFFPTEEESRGTVSIAWRGPMSDQRSTWINLSLLWTYLTDSAASPLQKAFVECDDPLCAGVYPAHEVFTVGYHQLWFTEVETERMEEVAPKLFDVLLDIVKNDAAAAESSLDLDRMQMVIRRQRRKILEKTERRPTNALIDPIIRNFMYGKRENPVQEMKDLQDDVDPIPLLEDALLNMTKSDWIELMQEFILSKPYALVLGRPSADLAKKIAKEEKEREEQQAIDLGPEKLKQLGGELEKAMEYNEREIPDGVLTSVPIPRLENVKSIPLLTIRGVGESIDIATNSGKGISKED